MAAPGIDALILFREQTAMARKDWDQVKDIFNTALRQNTDERVVFLDAVCKDDIDLRIEVESLLIAFDEGKSFLETPVVGEASTKSQWRLCKDQIISHFKILSPIASGGMGEVYLAEDQKLGRYVALKILPESFNEDRNRMKRFEREARAVSSLNHPNILTIFEFDEQDLMHMFASEFVKGETLREHIKRGNIPVSECLDIGIQVASALQAAHAAGVIHRDIKPENIMIRDDGLVKVLDFGLAKLTERLSNDNAGTQTEFFSNPGLIMGTAAYMSPEQARAVSIDARSDIYSLGVVLYEMLAGKTPFSGKTTVDVIAAMIQTDSPHVRTVVPNVPADLDAIIARAMEKDRSDRYHSAEETLAAMKQLRKDIETGDRLFSEGRDTADAEKETEILAAQPTSTDKAAATNISRKFRYAMAAVIVLTIVALGGYWYFGNRAVGQIDSIAVLPFENQSGNPDVEYLSDGVTDSLINSLSKIPGLNVRPRSTVFHFKGQDLPPTELGKRLSVQAIITGRVVQRGNDLAVHWQLIDAETGYQIWGESYESKLPDLAALRNEITLDVSRKLRAGLSGQDEQRLRKNYTENSEAYGLYLKGRYYALRLTPDEIRKGISYYEQAIAVDPNYALAYVGLADAYRAPLLELPTSEALPKAKAAAKRAIEIDDTLAEAHAVLGWVIHWYEWNWAEAENEFKKALALDPNSADSHLYYAHLLSVSGRHEEALREAKRARELDPLNLRTNLLAALFLLQAGRTDEAISRIMENSEICPNCAGPYLFLSFVYAKKGMYPEAIAQTQKSAELGRSSNSLSRLAYVLAKGGKPEQARSILNELLNPERGPRAAPYLIATVYNGLGEREKTLYWLERALEERDSRLILLKVDFQWGDDIRSEPRFQNIMLRVGFPS